MQEKQKKVYGLYLSLSNRISRSFCNHFLLILV